MTRSGVTRTGARLCLNMIVKNERANLERCLAAVADHIACWVIVDTGSADGTQDFVQDFFATRRIPGVLQTSSFVDFAQARNLALDCARASSLEYDYLLLVDADMELVVHDPDFAMNLQATAYRVMQRAGISYWNARLLHRDARAWYRGVTHEYLDVQGSETCRLDGISFMDHASGANRSEKNPRDLRLLTQALACERDPRLIARYTFYLANTLRDSGDYAGARTQYLRRARLGHWQEEVFLSLLEVARLSEKIGHPESVIVGAYRNACLATETRAEAFHDMARFCRGNGRYAEAFAFASYGYRIDQPRDGLFVEDWIYRYGLLDEVAIAAYWTGRYEEALQACDKLLSEGQLPDDQRPRVIRNRALAASKCGKDVSFSPGSSAAAV